MCAMVAFLQEHAEIEVGKGDKSDGSEGKAERKGWDSQCSFFAGRTHKVGEGDGDLYVRYELRDVGSYPRLQEDR